MSLALFICARDYSGVMRLSLFPLLYRLSFDPDRGNHGHTCKTQRNMENFYKSPIIGDQDLISKSCRDRIDKSQRTTIQDIVGFESRYFCSQIMGQSTEEDILRNR